MKIKDILGLTDKRNKEYGVDLTKLAEELGHEYYYNSYEDDKDIEVYWLSKWVCTDTEVGQRVYFLNDEPVCYSTQSARREDEIFYFFDEECVVKLKQYFFNRELELFKNKVSYKRYDDELSTVYNVKFNDHLDNQTEGYIGDELVEIVEFLGGNDFNNISDNIKVKYPNGETKVVNVSELNIPIYLTEKFNDSLEPFHETNELGLKGIKDKFDIVNLESYIKLVKNGESSYNDEICLVYCDDNNKNKVYKLNNFKNASIYFKNLESLFDYYKDVYGEDFDKEFKNYIDFCEYFIKDDVERKYIKGNEKLSKVKDLEFKVILNSK